MEGVACLGHGPFNSAAVEVSERVGGQLSECGTREKLGRKALTSQHKESDPVVVVKFETLLVGDLFSFVGSHVVDRTTIWHRGADTSINTSKIIAHYP